MVDAMRESIEATEAAVNAAVGAYPTPTAYLCFGPDGSLKQKWQGQDGEFWVNVPAVPRDPAAPVSPPATPAPTVN
jgi:hypothetical protein